MFSQCSSLLSLPDIEKWNLCYFLRKEDMFSGCKELKAIPEKFRNRKRKKKFKN